MSDKPILFSAPMIRAIIEGRKTQTRRILKPQPDDIFEGKLPAAVRISVGDRLWVRETWSGIHDFRNTPPAQRQSCMTPDGPFLREDIHFWADGNPLGGDYEKPRPGIHMPRWASRLTLVVTDVRVERLHDISEDDAKAEGAVPYHVRASGLDYYGSQHAMCGQDHRAGFCHIWESINGIESWDANPWVVAYSFDVLRGNIDSIDRRAA